MLSGSGFTKWILHKIISVFRHHQLPSYTATTYLGATFAHGATNCSPDCPLNFYHAHALGACECARSQAHRRRAPFLLARLARGRYSTSTDPPAGRRRRHHPSSRTPSHPKSCERGTGKRGICRRAQAWRAFGPGPATQRAPSLWLAPSPTPPMPRSSASHNAVPGLGPPAAAARVTQSLTACAQLTRRTTAAPHT
jgi:hypothetical protein